jgi:hypothetical protein
LLKLLVWLARVTDLWQMLLARLTDLNWQILLARLARLDRRVFLPLLAWLNWVKLLALLTQLDWWVLVPLLTRLALLWELLSLLAMLPCSCGICAIRGHGKEAR